LLKLLGHFFDIFRRPSGDVHAETQAHAGQHFLDFVQGLAAEVRGAQHFRFGLLHEIANIDDIVVLEAVGGADAEFQFVDLLEQIAVELVGIAFCLALLGRHADWRGNLFQRFLEMHKQLQLVLKDAGRIGNRVFRGNGTIGFDGEVQLVKIQFLANAGIVDLVGYLTDRRVKRVDRDQANGCIGRTVGNSRYIALADIDGQFHVQRGAFVEMADHQIRVHDFDVAGDGNVASLDFGRAGRGKLQTLGIFAFHFQGDLLDVQDDVCHIFANAGQRRKFVQGIFDLDRGNRRTLERGQEHAAQRVAHGQAETTLERLRNESRLAFRITAGLDVKDVGLLQFLPVLHIDSHGLPLVVQRAAVDVITALNLKMRDRPSGRPRNSSGLDAAPFRGANTIVRNGGHVTDRGDREANSLKRPKRRFATGAGTLHLDFKRPHAMVGGFLARVFRCNLGCIRSRLARALEAHHARRGPAYRIALGIGDGDHRIVESGVDVRYACRNILARAFLYALRFACHVINSYLIS